jgi:hypothetical protein
VRPQIYNKPFPYSEKLGLRTKKVKTYYEVCKSDRPLFGGGNKSKILEQPQVLGQKFKIPSSVLAKGTVCVIDLNSNSLWHPNSWKPNSNLEYRRSLHPLDKAILPFHVDFIMKACQVESNTAVAFSKKVPDAMITSTHLRNLVSHGTPINDEIIFLFLETLWKNFDLAFLSPQFLTILQRDSWNKSIRLFSQTNRNRQ